MKKLIFAILTMFLASSACHATEKMSVELAPKNSYLIILENSAETVMSSDKDIISAKILTTIYNEKNQIILKANKEGTAKLYIALENEIIIIDVNSNTQNQPNPDVKCSKSIKDFINLDAPYIPTKRSKTNDFKLDSPPPLGEMK